MKLIKKSAIALALSAMSFAASAMTSIDESALSQVSGQDGVSIVADLNINIGSFTYTDTTRLADGTIDAANSGSVAFNNIGVRGGFIMAIDVLTGAQFATDAVTALSAAYYTNNGVSSAQTLAGAISASLGRDPASASDVVRFAFPVVAGAEADARKASMSITVDSITTGHGGASFGSVALKNFDLQGTKVWMFGH